ncbi:hypothetical protein CLAFUW4_09847 [Fulvia fulva]|uniref:Uncharacterized protein n=1 Tax=Passalora fulva TaxID=5499 RepID=A0A9Q8PIH0_PASFU|nr:uncharacterized protein CLAFUR5_12392 [Fulvia fulva]KAK4615770.1 hypothetical protein CLAFUR4_09853 [Fulvia fulva]KAK4616353.1 hypothetical protein CLAFUR0_09846 [Fulvia fulva]UJO23041.1 hypothetical protein CLAFUR5_12392 [Fulvia fulva]WPV19264.1 hypothetical protein CLAFUW4_09847 [Fulvia fulva]WPV33797.1 hypothetical protein CLAFUW7_09850 [Fulvia fulva]
MPSTPSLSSVEEASNSKVRFSDLTEDWKNATKNGLRSLKRKNPNAKKVVIKGQSHPSSTVATHTNVISCQLQDANGGYLGSGHIDETGEAYPNEKFEKIAAKK